MHSAIYHALAVVIVLVGLVGTVLPIVPGVLLVYGGLLLAAWADGFTRVGGWGVGIMTGLAALSLVVDFAGAMVGAKRVGASPQALAGATIGAVLGIFLGIWGLVVGPFVGAFAGELVARRDVVRAGKAGLGTWIGLVAAAVAKLVIAFLMIATFLAFYLLNR